jgi:hypothetical protein
MSRLTNLREESTLRIQHGLQIRNNTATIHFATTDVVEMNMFRRAILAEIETFAIDEVNILINTGPRIDELLALRLGQLVIDHTRFAPPPEGDFKTRIDFEGPGMLTTDHIPGIPFTRMTPIMELRAGQRVLCDVVVKLGQAKTHAKWRPVSKVTFAEVEGGYDVTIKSVGMLPPSQIFELGLAKIGAAREWEPITIFSRPFIPHNV